MTGIFLDSEKQKVRLANQSGNKRFEDWAPIAVKFCSVSGRVLTISIHASNPQSMVVEVLSCWYAEVVGQSNVEELRQNDRQCVGEVLGVDPRPKESNGATYKHILLPHPGCILAPAVERCRN